MSQQKSRLIRPGNVFPIFYCPILVSLCEYKPLFPVLSWQERHPVWSSAAVAHLFRVRSVVRSEMVFCTPGCNEWLFEWLLPFIISNQSAHSPLTSDIELLPCDWLISNLCYQAIEQVYLIKWLVSVYCIIIKCKYLSHYKWTFSTIKCTSALHFLASKQIMANLLQGELMLSCWN